jgi:hypothetical protein
VRCEMGCESSIVDNLQAANVDVTRTKNKNRTARYVTFLEKGMATGLHRCSSLRAKVPTGQDAVGMDRPKLAERSAEKREHSQANFFSKTFHERESKRRRILYDKVTKLLKENQLSCKAVWLRYNWNDLFKADDRALILKARHRAHT